MTASEGRGAVVPQRDIVVVGASAGGVQALVDLARDLPADFDGAVFVTLHVMEGARSLLAGILDRAGPLPASTAVDCDEIEPRRIVVAPPDHHLLLEDGRMRVLRRPKVNGHRPSVDVLFHSAARAYGSRVAGVVLSGALRDGALGLKAIKRRGGVAIVQADPLHQGMPESAIATVDVDAVLPLREIARELTMIVGARKEGDAMDKGDHPHRPRSRLRRR